MWKALTIVSLLFAAPDPAAYLQAHHQVLDSGNKTLDIPLLTADSNDYLIYLSGELHRARGNNQGWLQLFRYLHAQKGVRLLVIESGHATAVLVNEFLRTGKMGVLKYGVKWRDEYSFFRSLLKFYNSLPDDQKFTVVGIDHEDDPTTIQALKLMLPAAVAPDSIEATIERVRATPVRYRLSSSDKETNLALEILELYEANPAPFATYFGNRFAEFELIMATLAMKERFAGINFNKTASHVKANREAVLTENIRLAQKAFPGQKMFGQFGRLHIPIAKRDRWDRTDNWTSLAALLNTGDDVFANRVCSLAYLYWYEFEKSGRTLSIGLSQEDIEAIKTVSPKKRLTLVRLNDEQSPFEELAAGAYQYLLVNRRGEGG